MQSRNRITQSRAELFQSGRELTAKMGTTLASARALYLDLLSHMWLYISGGLNCCQEFRRGVIYRLIEVRIEHVKDVNLQTKELGCN